MRCPKCQFDHPLQTIECLKCGIIFSKYKPPADLPGTSVLSEVVTNSRDMAVLAKPGDGKMAAAVVSSLAMSLETALSSDADKSPAEIHKEASREFIYRLLALPLALLAAYWVTGTGFNMVAGMLAMVVHECGHAITAWLAGRWAIPTFWFTMMGENSSWFMVLLVTGGILFAGYQAWRRRQWGWVCACAAILVLQMNILSMTANRGAVVIFAGDGGALVLATILMGTFYAPCDSALGRSWGLRWGLLIIGTLAFMHVYRLWSGPWDNIPFGEIEGQGPSDPTLLTEMYGWSVIQLVDRYLLLARACFMAMGAIYLWGLMSAYATMRVPVAKTYQGLENQTTR